MIADIDDAYVVDHDLYSDDRDDGCDDVDSDDNDYV